MARYTSITPPEEDGISEGSSTVKLELDNWIIPMYWEADGGRQPEDWPEAAVESLINLFTGRTSLEPGSEGIEIPDVLGWHIATLIDDREGHQVSITADPLEGMSEQDRRDTWRAEVHQMAAYGGGYTLDALATKRAREERVRTTRFIVEHNQRWYAMGIQLYAAATPEERENWKSSPGN